MPQTADEVVFRRIGGRVVPIKTGNKGQQAIGAGISATGIAGSLYAGKAAARTARYKAGRLMKTAIRQRNAAFTASNTKGAKFIKKFSMGGAYARDFQKHQNRINMLKPMLGRASFRGLGGAVVAAGTIASLYAGSKYGSANVWGAANGR